MTHAGYILAAYLGSAIVLIGTIALVSLDLRAARRKLERLEQEGLSRRREVPR